MVDALCYACDGGSGYHFTRADVLQMDVDEANFYLERLGEHRKGEAERIRNKGGLV